MRLKAPLILSIGFTLLMGGTVPSPFQRPDIQHDLAALTKRGFTFRMLDNDLIELTDPVSGEKHLKSLREPSEASIRSWAAAKGVPILEIDPTQVDTTRYAGWYNYWTEVPLSNSEGQPLVVADLDRNGKPEVYGGYHDYTSQDFEARVYEIDSNGGVQFRHKYVPRPGVSILSADVNQDSLSEILWSRGGGLYDYEQPAADSLPTILRFRHEQFKGGVDPGYTGIYVGSLDGDNLTDLLYKGSEPDSANPNQGISKVYVAEYNPDSNDFIRAWSSDYGFNGNVSAIGGFAVDDFDGDGRKEFVVSHELSGQVFVTENVGDNTFQQTWRDSTPFVNLYYLASGDVDGDGRPEFFVGATMSSGNWTLAYEADSNNAFSLRFMFHLLSGGSLDIPTYLTTDVDGYGRPDLVIFSGAFLYVFKGGNKNDYFLFYLRREMNRRSIQYYDLNADGRKDYLVSKDVLDTLGRFRLKADLYRATYLLQVDEPSQPLRSQLFQSYPNPFNGRTTIRYSIPFSQHVRVRVFDCAGRQVRLLIDRRETFGDHEVIWNAANTASGIYFCRLETGIEFATIKILLVK